MGADSRLTLDKKTVITIKPILLATAIGGIVFANAAFAHGMDTDQDGLYSLAEMRTEYSNLTEEQYAELDTNKDEAVDVDELTAAIADGILPAMD